VTSFGTIIYLDPATGLLRHGDRRTSPQNVFLLRATKMRPASSLTKAKTAVCTSCVWKLASMPVKSTFWTMPVILSRGLLFSPAKDVWPSTRRADSFAQSQTATLRFLGPGSAAGKPRDCCLGIT